jgi:opacity protein-like surface antigen
MTAEFPLANDRLIPFVTGGGGVGRLSQRLSFGFPNRPTLPRPFFDSPLLQPFRDISAAETGLAVTLGGGLDVQLWRGLAVGADVRWLRLLAGRDTLDFSYVAARTSYRF